MPTCHPVPKTTKEQQRRSASGSYIVIQPSLPSRKDQRANHGTSGLAVNPKPQGLRASVNPTKEAHDDDCSLSWASDGRPLSPPHTPRIPGVSTFYLSPSPEDMATRAETMLFRWLRAEWSETWLANHLSTNESSFRS